MEDYDAWGKTEENLLMLQKSFKLSQKTDQANFSRTNSKSEGKVRIGGAFRQIQEAEPFRRKELAKQGEFEAIDKTQTSHQSQGNYVAAPYPVSVLVTIWTWLYPCTPKPWDYCSMDIQPYVTQYPIAHSN